MKVIALATCLLLGLGACTSQVDGRVVILPRIEVETTNASVGEEVTVTLSGGYDNIAEAHSPDLIVPNYRLGACFGRDLSVPYAPVGGLCLNQDLPLPAYIEIAEGQSHQQRFGRQVVRSGERLILEHTFSFTATEPGLVTVFPVSQVFFESNGEPAVENDVGFEITFK